MPDVLQVQTTTDQRELALAIARDLVERRLAACVQISGPVTSVYRWQGKIETATEWQCTAKTTTALYEAVAQRIGQLHSYEEPEIIATEIPSASASYIQWLKAQLAAPGDGPDTTPARP